MFLELCSLPVLTCTWPLSELWQLIGTVRGYTALLLQMLSSYWNFRFFACTMPKMRILTSSWSLIMIGQFGFSVRDCENLSNEARTNSLSLDRPFCSADFSLCAHQKYKYTAFFYTFTSRVPRPASSTSSVALSCWPRPLVWTSVRSSRFPPLLCARTSCLCCVRAERAQHTEQQPTAYHQKAEEERGRWGERKKGERKQQKMIMYFV